MSATQFFKQILNEFSVVSYLKQSHIPSKTENKLLQTWKFSFGKGLSSDKKEWDKSGIEEILPLIKEWYIMEMEFRVFGEQKMFKAIEHIEFPFLRQVVITTMAVESIEPINRIQMKMIQILNIDANKLCSIKSLRKAHWPELKGCSLGFNPAADLSLLTQMYQQSIGIFGSSFSTVDDARWISKIHAPKLKILSIFQKQCPEFDDLEHYSPCIRQIQWQICILKKYRGLKISCATMENQQSSEESLQSYLLSVSDDSEESRQQSSSQSEQMQSYEIKNDQSFSL